MATGPLTKDAEIQKLRGQMETLAGQLAAAEARLREMGIADPITGLFSYRYFLGRITEEVARADRFGLEISCLFVALDTPSFEGLLEVARSMRDACRQYDIPARWGQHELAMLLPATDVDGAMTFAERLRIGVANAFSSHPALPKLTISAGIATYPRDGVEDAQQLLEAASVALNHAREAGGNRTVLRP